MLFFKRLTTVKNLDPRKITGSTWQKFPPSEITLSPNGTWHFVMSHKSTDCNKNKK